MSTTGYLTNHLLIAMPALADQNFSRAVTYICEHNEDGALGLIINRPGDVTLEEILRQMNLRADDEKIAAQRVYQGGPVSPERGFVLHGDHSQWEATLRVSPDTGVTSSRDILEAIAEGRGPEHYLMALGYAGWSAGQLDEEMRENAWLSVPAQHEILFHTPVPQRWQAATRLLGIDPARLSGDAGHA